MCLVESSRGISILVRATSPARGSSFLPEPRLVSSGPSSCLCLIFHSSSPSFDTTFARPFQHRYQHHHYCLTCDKRPPHHGALHGSPRLRPNHRHRPRLRSLLRPLRLLSRRLWRLPHRRLLSRPVPPNRHHRPSWRQICCDDPRNHKRRVEYWVFCQCVVYNLCGQFLGQEEDDLCGRDVLGHWTDLAVYEF